MQLRVSTNTSKLFLRECGDMALLGRRRSFSNSRDYPQDPFLRIHIPFHVAGSVLFVSDNWWHRQGSDIVIFACLYGNGGTEMTRRLLMSTINDFNIPILSSCILLWRVTQGCFGFNSGYPCANQPRFKSNQRREHNKPGAEPVCYLGTSLHSGPFHKGAVLFWGPKRDPSVKNCPYGV